jgi:hypothetical protein
VNPANESSTFTLSRVQAMLGLSRYIVGGLIAEGFVTPGRGTRNEWRFTFQDVTLLRTAHALQAQGIAPRRILRSLARLKAMLPAELPLTGLRITAIGADVAVRDRSGRLQADSGQMLMDFDVAPVAGSVTILEREPSPPAELTDARELFERAQSLKPPILQPPRAHISGCLHVSRISRTRTSTWGSCGRTPAASANWCACPMRRLSTARTHPCCISTGPSRWTTSNASTRLPPATNAASRSIRLWRTHISIWHNCTSRLATSAVRYAT